MAQKKGGLCRAVGKVKLWMMVLFESLILSDSVVKGIKDKEGKERNLSELQRFCFRALDTFKLFKLIPTFLCFP